MKMTCMSYAFGLTCVMAASLLAPAAMAQGGGDGVTGALQIGQERFTLKHAFAVMEEDPFSNGQKEKLVVLLSDVPLPNEMRRASNDWRIWLSEQAGAGAIHGIVLNIDPETKVWDSGNLATKGGLMFYTESVFGGEERSLRFDPSGALGDRVAGKLSMKKPMAAMSDQESTWRAEAEFRSAVVRRPAVTAVLTGADALKSPQYKIARAFLEACRKKDVEAIRATIEARSSGAMMAMFIGADKEDTLNRFAQMAADTLGYQLVKITVRGDTADLRFKDSKPDAMNSQTLYVALSAGQWKIVR